MLVTALALVACQAPATSPEPRSPAATGGVLIVLGKSDDSATLVDVQSGEALATLPTGEGPHEVAVAPDGRTAVVTNYGRDAAGRTLTVLDLGQRQVAYTLELEGWSHPHGIVFEDAGHLLVTAEDQKALLRVDLASGEARAFPSDQAVSHMVVHDPRRRRAYVANIGSGSLTVIDLEKGERVANVPTGAGAEGLALAPDGSAVWVANRAADTISIVDPKTLEVTATVACGAFPIRIAFTPDGRRVLASNARSGDVAVIDVETREIVGRVPMPPPEAPTEGEGRLFDASFSTSSIPIGILVEPSGKRAWIANSNADRVVCVDLESLEIVAAVEGGREPDGLGWYERRPATGER